MHTEPHWHGQLSVLDEMRGSVVKPVERGHLVP